MSRAHLARQLAAAITRAACKGQGEAWTEWEAAHADAVTTAQADRRRRPRPRRWQSAPAVRRSPPVVGPRRVSTATPAWPRAPPGSTGCDARPPTSCPTRDHPSGGPDERARLRPLPAGRAPAAGEGAHPGPLVLRTLAPPGQTRPRWRIAARRTGRSLWDYLVHVPGLCHLGRDPRVMTGHRASVGRR